MLSSKFTAWLEDKGVLYRKIRADFVPEGWRGIICTEPLSAGNLVMVPEAALMSCKSAQKDLQLNKAMDQLDHKLQDAEILAVHLIYEVSKKDRSFWHPYLEQLPPRFDGYSTLSHFRFEHATELQMNVALEVVRAVKEKSHRSWKRCRDALYALGVEEELRSLKAFRWAEATISSRTMHVPWSSAGALVPFADFFNYRPPPASPTPQLELTIWPESDGAESEPISCGDGFYDRARGCYQIVTHKRYDIGEQVFLCYGRHTNLELLEHYGFVLEDNPHDTVLLPSSLFEASTSLTSISATECHVTATGVPSWELMRALRVSLLSQQEQKSHAYLAAAGQPCSTSCERQVWKTVLEACKQHLSSYPTSIAEDRKLLGVAEETGNHKLECAIQWRVGQKRILERAIDKFSYTENYTRATFD